MSFFPDAKNRTAIEGYISYSLADISRNSPVGVRVERYNPQSLIEDRVIESQRSQRYKNAIILQRINTWYIELSILSYILSPPPYKRTRVVNFRGTFRSGFRKVPLLFILFVNDHQGTLDTSTLINEERLRLLLSHGVYSSRDGQPRIALG